MNHLTRRTLRRPRSATVVLSASACVLGLALTACGGNSSDDSGSSGGTETSSAATSPAAGTSSSATAPSASGSAAGADLSTVMSPVSSYTIPTDAIDAGSLSGKTFFYIPITQQTPAFKVTSDAMTAALKAVGAKVQICDGGANPATTSACVNQAVTSGAAGVVADSIPYGFAANAFAAAQAKGVPVLLTDQLPEDDAPASATLAYIPGPGNEMLEAIAQWIAKDSDGKAVVVANEVTDNPSSITYMDHFQSALSAACSSCKVTINKISAANFALVAPSTSSAILKTPGVNYVLSEFDAFIQPTFGGIQQSGKASSIKLVSTAATADSLKTMGQGQPPVADVGQSLPFQGWADADAVMRLALKQTVGDYTTPYRLFDKTNVGDLDLSDAGVASGSWFGPTTFTDQFKTLWGVS